MTEKRQISQGYIIHILRNFCPDLSRSKFHSKGERSIISILKVYYLNDKGVHDFEKRMIISKLL